MLTTVLVFRKELKQKTQPEIHTNVYGINKNYKEWSDPPAPQAAPPKKTPRNRKEKIVTREQKAVTRKEYYIPSRT